MNTTDLSSGWRCIDTEPDAGDAAAFSAPGLNTATWLPIGVPGDVNAVLLAAGRIPNPHLGDNARRCYWVTARDWWCRLEFAYRAPDDSPQTDLCLNGVDGHTEIYLNGVLLGRMENAFRPYRFPVADCLRADAPNVVLIRLKSIDRVLGGPRLDELGGWYDRRTLMRKPQFSFGWDWSLPLPSIGLGGPICLEHHGGARLLDVSVQPRISGRLDFKFQVTAAARQPGYALVVRVRGHGVDRS